MQEEIYILYNGFNVTIINDWLINTNIFEYFNFTIIYTFLMFILNNYLYIYTLIRFVCHG